MCPLNARRVGGHRDRGQHPVEVIRERATVAGLGEVASRITQNGLRTNRRQRVGGAVGAGGGRAVFGLRRPVADEAEVPALGLVAVGAIPSLQAVAVVVARLRDREAVVGHQVRDDFGRLVLVGVPVVGEARGRLLDLSPFSPPRKLVTLSLVCTALTSATHSRLLPALSLTPLIWSALSLRFSSPIDQRWA